MCATGLDPDLEDSQWQSTSRKKGRASALGKKAPQNMATSQPVQREARGTAKPIGGASEKQIVKSALPEVRKGKVSKATELKQQSTARNQKGANAAAPVSLPTSTEVARATDAWSSETVPDSSGAGHRDIENWPALSGSHSAPAWPQLASTRPSASYSVASVPIQTSQPSPATDLGPQLNKESSPPPRKLQGKPHPSSSPAPARLDDAAGAPPGGLRSVSNATDRMTYPESAMHNGFSAGHDLRGLQMPVLPVNGNHESTTGTPVAERFGDDLLMELFPQLLRTENDSTVVRAVNGRQGAPSREPTTGRLRPPDFTPSHASMHSPTGFFSHHLSSVFSGVFEFLLHSCLYLRPSPVDDCV